MNLPLDYSRTPEEAGAWTAMMLGGGYLLSAGGPWLAGWARDSGAKYELVFATMAVIALILIAMAVPLRPSPETR